MAFLFGSKKTKHPSELVKQTKETLASMEKSKGSSKNAEKANEVISQNILQMKHILGSDPQADQNQEMINLLASEIYSSDLLMLLIQHLGDFEFEAKKDIISLFNYLLRKQQGGKYTTVEYLCKNSSFLDELVRGFGFLLFFNLEFSLLTLNSRLFHLFVG